MYVYNKCDVFNDYILFSVTVTPFRIYCKKKLQCSCRLHKGLHCFVMQNIQDLFQIVNNLYEDDYHSCIYHFLEIHMLKFVLQRLVLFHILLLFIETIINIRSVL